MRTAAAWSFPCGGCFCPAGRKATGLTSCTCRFFCNPLAGAVFARRDAKRRAMLFESARPCESDICAKENRQCISTPAVFSWARVDYASRAAKNSPLGCFCAVFGDSAAAVRIHPWICFEKFRTKEKLQHLYDSGVLGGRGWIRTTEAEKQQIYSLSPLATREHAHILFVSVAGRLA